MPRLEALPDTPQWHAARRGCATASRAEDIVAVTKKGEPTADRQRYLIELVAERMTGTAVPHYVTQAMQDGIDREPLAVAEYEIATGNVCNRSGFYLHDTIEYFGATPDREIGQDGLLEVKCPTTPTFVRWIMAGGVPDQHKPQMLAQLAVTRRKWCDFVAFDPTVQNGPKLYICRFEPTAEEIFAMETAVMKFLADVEAAFDAITQRGEL